MPVVDGCIRVSGERKNDDPLLPDRLDRALELRAPREPEFRTDFPKEPILARLERTDGVRVRENFVVGCPARKDDDLRDRTDRRGGLERRADVTTGRACEAWADRLGRANERLRPAPREVARDFWIRGGEPTLRLEIGAPRALDRDEVDRLRGPAHDSGSPRDMVAATTRHH